MEWWETKTAAWGIIIIGVGGGGVVTYLSPPIGIPICALLLLLGFVLLIRAYRHRRKTSQVKFEENGAIIQITDIYEDNTRECGLIVNNAGNNPLKNCHARLMGLAFETPHTQYSLEKYPKSEDLVCSQEFPQHGDGKIPLFRWGPDMANKDLEIVYKSGKQKIGYGILNVPILVLLNVWVDNFPATYAVCKLEDRLGWGYQLSILETGILQNEVKLTTYQKSNPDIGGIDYQ